jgi:hypothetical protein
LLLAGEAAAATINATNRHAYGANIGWLDARGDAANGAVIGQFFCTGHVWSANCGWISLGNGPTNGWQYGNAAAADWGVNHDGVRVACAGWPTGRTSGGSRSRPTATRGSAC